MYMYMYVHNVQKAGLKFICGHWNNSYAQLYFMSTLLIFSFLTISFLHGLMRWRDMFKLSRRNATGNAFNSTCTCMLNTKYFDVCG